MDVFTALLLVIVVVFIILYNAFRMDEVNKMDFTPLDNKAKKPLVTTKKTPPSEKEDVDVHQLQQALSKQVEAYSEPEVMIVPQKK